MNLMLAFAPHDPVAVDSNHKALNLLGQHSVHLLFLFSCAAFLARGSICAGFLTWPCCYSFVIPG